MIERFDLRTMAPQRWKNGAGLTREIARGGTDDSDFDWRLSVAEVERHATFSVFPDVDRCIVLLNGDGMRLSCDDGSVDHRLVEPLAPFHFRGDLPLTATLVGTACSDLNVMTRRGFARSDVVGHRAPARLRPAAIVFALCVEGEWLAVDGHGAQRLQPRQCALWRDPSSSIDLRPTRAEATSGMLSVRLDTDRPA